MGRTLEIWEIERANCIEAVESYRTAKKFRKRAEKNCAELLGLAELANESGDYKSAEAYLECAGQALKQAKDCRQLQEAWAKAVVIHFRQMKEDRLIY